MRKTFLLIFALCATMMAWGETTVTRTVKDDLATEYGWVNKTSKPYNVYQSFYLDGNISVVANSATSTTTTSNDVNGIYSSPRWFVYQSDNKGSFTISAANGYVIKSVKLKYFTADNGVLSLKDDASTAAADQIASGAVVDVNKPSVTFYTGKSATGTRPRIGIESFEVTYEKGGIVETYLDWNFGAPSTETEKVGALGTWKVIYTNAGQAQDTLADGKRTQAVGLYTRAGSSSPYTLTQGQIISPAIEGGIKYVSFRWNQMYTGTNTFSISCQATGKEAQSASFTGTSSNKVDKIFTYSPAVKNNTSTITIKNANTNASNNARLVVGPITIVPYLLFTQKTAEVNALEQNSYTYPADKLINNTEDGTVTYSIKSNSGATINAATGEVNLTTVTSAATDTITATWGEVTTTYSLTISYTAPAEGTYWKEGFSNFKAEGYTGYTTDIAGDYGIVWIARNFRHKTSDNSDKVDGEYGVRLNYAAKDANKDGYIETNSLEGGVKRLQFKWKTPSNSENPKFTVELDGETAYTVDQPQTKEQSGTVYNFGYNANIAKNAKFTIRVTNGTCASIFGPLTIVPYLYYKTKSHTIENATEGATYTNPDLINNIDEGAITYSLIGEGADDIASIDTDGKVTVKAGGVVTVQAKWVPEGAEEDEFVTTTYELTINFPQPTITFNNIEVALDGTVTPDITVVLNEEDITETATISYEVADENIATWDATNGWKLKTNGTTQVTAKVERTAQYGAASATATMTVNTMTFAEGTFFTENFGGEATSGYSTKAENWRGKDNVYPWTFLNWRRYADRVRITMTKPESSNINGYIYMNPFDDDALEGGIKAVQVTWSAPGASSLATDFYVDDMKHSDATKVTIKKEAGASTAQQITQAIFNSKTNDAQLRIRIGSLDKSAIDVYSVDIVPYLLYTKKEVPVTYELEGTNTVDASDNLINNLEEDETVT
ncbi:MAG: hypothetical protein MJZ58_01095, partial [Paludibacteraceae bacterium]|nr:hypothetical protein [Paludibacteraceae bacterium]